MLEFVYHWHKFNLYIYVSAGLYEQQERYKQLSFRKRSKYKFDIAAHDSKPMVGRKNIDGENSNCGLIYGGKHNRCVIFPAK